jgi:hypothetical protein
MIGEYSPEMSDEEVRRWAVEAQELIYTLKDKLYSAKYILEECEVWGLSKYTGLSPGVIAAALQTIFSIDKQ